MLPLLFALVDVCHMRLSVPYKALAMAGRLLITAFFDADLACQWNFWRMSCHCAYIYLRISAACVVVNCVHADDVLVCAVRGQVIIRADRRFGGGNARAYSNEFLKRQLMSRLLCETHEVERCANHLELFLQESQREILRTFDQGRIVFGLSIGI